MLWPMTRQSLFAFALVSLIGCSSYTVIKQAEPNPFPAQQCKVAVAPVTFDNIRIGKSAEADWLAKKGAEEVAAYQTDKQTVNTLFTNQVVSKASPFVAAGAAGPFVAKPRLTMWEPGFYSAFVNHDSEASMVVEITDDKGTVLDEVTFSTRVPASIYNPSTGGRMHTASKQLGSIFASYLATRLSCAK
jgi:hypothetical protein